jgi:hypothetical protein
VSQLINEGSNLRAPLNQSERPLCATRPALSRHRVTVVVFPCIGVIITNSMASSRQSRPNASEIAVRHVIGRDCYPPLFLGLAHRVEIYVCFWMSVSLRLPRRSRDPFDFRSLRHISLLRDDLSPITIRVSLAYLLRRDNAGTNQRFRHILANQCCEMSVLCSRRQLRRAFGPLLRGLSWPKGHEKILGAVSVQRKELSGRIGCEVYQFPGRG